MTKGGGIFVNVRKDIPSISVDFLIQESFSLEINLRKEEDCLITFTMATSPHIAIALVKSY